MPLDFFLFSWGLWKKENREKNTLKCVFSLLHVWESFSKNNPLPHQSLAVCSREKWYSQGLLRKTFFIPRAWTWSCVLSSKVTFYPSRSPCNEVYWWLLTIPSVAIIIKFKAPGSFTRKRSNSWNSMRRFIMGWLSALPHFSPSPSLVHHPIPC